MTKLESVSFPRNTSLKPRRVELSPRGIADELPEIIASEGRGESLAHYIRGKRDELNRLLTRCGALLFRGFDVSTPEHFSGALAELDPEIINYTERSSPRRAVGDRVYTSTDHPSDQDIVLHSEQSYTLNWPCLICFYCAAPAATGGSTPIADNRKILKHLPAQLRQRFEEFGVLYQRTYTQGLGLSWQAAFQTESRTEVRRLCEERDIAPTWLPDDRLQTRQRRSAFQVHPVSREVLWFNHALFFHVTSLDPAVSAALVEAVGIDYVPTNTFFGNGDPFSAEDLAAMRLAVAREKRSFTWQRGDVLVLDNMLCQHGREPFTGERSVLTLMARPYASQ